MEVITFKAGKNIQNEIKINGKDKITGREVDLIGPHEVDLSDSNRPFGRIVIIDEDIEAVGIIIYNWPFIDGLFNFLYDIMFAKEYTTEVKHYDKRRKTYSRLETCS